MATIIIKLEHSNLLQHSREGVKIQKIVSSISPLNISKLLFKSDTKSSAASDVYKRQSYYKKYL